MKRLAKAGFELSFHIVAIGVILAAFFPMAQWYFDATPLWGVDFYYTASLVNLLKDSLTLPPLSWNYAWFAGWPNFSSFPMLHYYLILPFTYFNDLLSAVKTWMNLSTGLFIVGIYALSFLLSRNRGLAIILAVASVYSVGVYGALMWGGSLPNHATQASFPWTLFFIIIHLKTRRTMWLFTAACIAGLSILGHPQIAIAYIFPSSALLFLFAFGQMKMVDRIKSGILFVLVAIVVGLPVIYTSTGSLKYLLVTDATEVATSTTRVDSELSQDIRSFHLAQPKRMYTDTNKTFFVFLAIAGVLYLVSLLFKHSRQEFLEGVPYIILALFYTAYIHVFAYGISMFHGGWYRLFWSVPIWMTLLISVWWGIGESTFKQKFGRLSWIVTPTFTIIALVLGLYFLQNYSQGVKEKIVPRSNPSSAFPDVLNMRADQEGFERLKKEMVPTWIDGQRVDYRIYDGDQTVNIWWNALYKMPLARGYFDPPNAQALGYRFWVDAAMSVDKTTGEDQLVGAFDYPMSIATNNTHYLIDWYSIKFFEGGRGGPTTFAPLPKSVTETNFIKNEQELDFNKERYNTGGQTLKYYEFRDEYVSPILQSTNTPTMGIFATDTGYETIVRVLADANLGSKVVIPIKLGSEVDQISATDLRTFDAVVLYNYKYQNKGRAFSQLKGYVENGGKLFIDTGTEVAESDAQDLPDIFPLKSTVRTPLGSEWDFVSLSTPLGEGVDFSTFDPPIFDNADWNLSYPPDASSLLPGSTVVLTHRGHPVIISHTVGNGEVIWSGMNLPYHVSRFHNEQEVLFFTNIVKNLLSASSSDARSSSSVAEFHSAQKRTIISSHAKGVLFKEEHYPGWRATVQNGNSQKSIKIWSSGPAYPGFMYISLPQEYVDSQSTITFTYRGSAATWFFSTVSLVTVLFIIDNIVLRGIILGNSTRWLARTVHKRMKRWWVKEDEE